MKKIVLVLFVLLFCPNVNAEESKKSDYEIAFQDGGIYALADNFENNIQFAYKILIKIEKLQGDEIEEVKDILINSINSNLSTLGHMAEDIEKKSGVSQQLYEHLKKEDERMGKVFEKSLGSKRASELSDKVEADSEKFWKNLKKDRKEKKWDDKYPNEKAKAFMEKQIELALAKLIRHGNIFQIE
ncbi:MAG: hypothetical protein OEZ38_10065 [Gammaproteobacteria bacterium]|nr:hypothetical protein [Gammaproteobacteria bacterium]